MSRSERSERRFVLGYSLALVILLLIPYAVAFARQGESWTFTGFLIGVEDGNSYIAKMLRGSQGAWLFRSPYTTMAQRGVLAFVPYLLLGRLASGVAVHEQLVALFHLFRILCIPLEVYAVYKFAAIFLPDGRARRWVTVVGTVGGGLGWLLILLGQPVWLGSLPLDVISPESFGFLALLTLPHLVLARALLLIGLAEYIRCGEAGRATWRPGLWFALLAWIHPLSSGVALAVIGLHLLFAAAYRWRQHGGTVLAELVSPALRAVLPPLPFVAYYGASLATDPYLATWAVQNRILSPGPWHYLLAYAIFLVPGVMGAIRVTRQGNVYRMLIVSWALALPLLAYAPTTIQRRMPEGIWVAIIVLAAVGIEALAGPNRRRITWLGWTMLVASLPTSLILYSGMLQVATHPARIAFRPAAEVRAFQWIGDQLPAGSVVLASFESSNAVPAWIPVQVPVGHGPESAGLERLMPQVQAFFDGDLGKSAARSFLQEHRVTAVLVGPEQADRIAWFVDRGSYLQESFSDDGYAVFLVRP